MKSKGKRKIEFIDDSRRQAFLDDKDPKRVELKQKMVDIKNKVKKEGIS